MPKRSIFISYAHEDRPDVESSAELLRAGGVHVFIDVDGIAYGDRWEQVLSEALNKCERMMVFWSLAAQASEWVEREWRYAMSLGKRIVPTLLDLTPLPEELKQFQALPRYRPSTAVAAQIAERGSPVSRTPRHKRSALASLVAALFGGAVVLGGAAALWTRPATMDVARTEPPAGIASAPAPAAVATGGIEHLLDVLDRAGKLATLPQVTAADMRRAAAELDVVFAEGSISRYDTAQLARLNQATELALTRLREVKTLIDAKRGGFSTREESAAFALLMQRVEMLEAERRVAEALSASSPTVPSSAPHSAPAPAPINSGPFDEPLPIAWLAATALALACVAAGLFRWFKKHQGAADNAEADRFVAQVFAI